MFKQSSDRELLMQTNPVLAAGFCFIRWLRHSLLIASDMITFLFYEAIINMIQNAAGQLLDCYGHSVSNLQTIHTNVTTVNKWVLLDQRVQAQNT